MFRKGFTFVEILVVITIIALLSVASFTSFFNFAQKQEGESQVSLFQSKLNAFELEFQKKNILNYTVSIQRGTGYIYEINRKDLFYSFLSTDFSSGTFSLQGNTSSGSIIKLESISDGKYLEDKYFQGGSSYSGTFEVGNEQVLKIYVDDNEKNTLGISYYSNKIDIGNSAKNLILKEIWTGENKSGQSFSGVVIKNTYGKKTVETFSGTLLGEAFLFFEKGGKEYTLKIP